MKRAYDSIPLNNLWPAMIENGVSKVHVRALSTLYTNIRSIKIGGMSSELLLPTKGLRPGCAVAPTLFEIYLTRH